MTAVQVAIAARVAGHLAAGEVVNLGIGIPTLVADLLSAEDAVTLETENGLLGVGPAPAWELADPMLVNAGKLPVTALPGASYFSSSTSFGYIRGGHVTTAVLGALQVDAAGRIANWALPGKPMLGVGGAMDLLVGARRVIVATTHTTRDGKPKIVERCGCPLTADRPVGAGVESMSRAPWVVPKAAQGYATGSVTMEDTSLGWRLVNDRMRALGHTDPLGITAETLAAEYGISREEQDRFAQASHRRARAAIDAGRLAPEIAPVQAPAGRRGTVAVTEDEGPRADTSMERLAALRPAFKPDGSLTAGNSSSLNDGAAAVLVCSEDHARRTDLPVLAHIRAMATAGVPPRVMGIGPVPATAKALQRAGLTLDDLDLIELNEAFAAQSLAVLRDWGIDPEDPRLNVNGGAIALGHPLGCSARVWSPRWSTSWAGGPTPATPSLRCASASARESP